MDATAVSRPRSSRPDRKILEAALALLADGGYRRLSMEGVAARAGVGKASVYRRWGSKPALVQAALQLLSQGIDVPDTGSLRGDFLALAETTLRSRDLPVISLVPRLLAEAAGEPELHGVVLGEFVIPRRRAVEIFLLRAKKRGEIAEDVDVDLAIDQFVGPIAYRLMVGSLGMKMPRKYVERVVDQLLAGLEPRQAT